MSTGPGDPPHRPSQEFAHDVVELKEDLAYERAELGESIRHDF
jgi:hypothetical protein